ncbi:transcription elongation factor A protein 3 [Scyliorhinus canicula]|uniref:transcription elongation factor A protein 3 n=1 Tax=Scyliorhinus canicula TaxID=7830 RepID=UPI0018F7935F|nr:transcription elongation factor A protein 3 [Scyliorhinus canicula]XP_038654714.1 transcription elongation factor A protein 3 [Scyliorhinus canicula]
MGREENLVRIAKRLDKMVSRKSLDGALDLLQELQGMKMTLQLLQSTRIGMSVNAMRKHSTDEEVITLAKILIKTWKKLLASEMPVVQKTEKVEGKEAGKKDKSATMFPAPQQHSKEEYVERQDMFSSKITSTASSMSRKNSTDGQQDRQRRNSSSSMSPLSRMNSTDAEESGGGSKGKTESPSSPTFSSPTILPPFLSTGVSIRDKCIEMMIAALKTDDDYKDYGANCDKMGAEIEDYIYQEFQKTDMKYKNRVRSRISNLKDPKNPNLRKNVLAGAIDLLHLARMTAEEMASDELKELRNVITKEAIREHQMAKTSGTHSSLFQCGKCRKKNCTYNQVQTRSADEPMTTFVLCNECGNRWKFC